MLLIAFLPVLLHQKKYKMTILRNKRALKQGKLSHRCVTTRIVAVYIRADFFPCISFNSTSKVSYITYGKFRNNFDEDKPLNGLFFSPKFINRYISVFFSNDSNFLNSVFQNPRRRGLVMERGKGLALIQNQEYISTESCTLMKFISTHTHTHARARTCGLYEPYKTQL